MAIYKMPWTETIPPCSSAFVPRFIPVISVDSSRITLIFLNEMIWRLKQREVVYIGVFALLWLLTTPTQWMAWESSKRMTINWSQFFESGDGNHPTRPAASFLDRVRTRWGDDMPPETRILSHIRGMLAIIAIECGGYSRARSFVYPKSYSSHTVMSDWLTVPPAGATVFENLYTFNRTIFIVTDKPASIPESRFILSRGLPFVRGQRLVFIINPEVLIR